MTIPPGISVVTEPSRHDGLPHKRTPAMPERTLPVPVPIRPAALVDRHRVQSEEALEASVARNTLLAYAYQWRSFVKWCAENARNPLPCKPVDVRDFCTDRHADGAAHSTIVQAVAAIRKQHIGNGLESPVDDGVRQVLRGLKKKSRNPRQAAPVRWEDALAAAALAAQDGMKGLRDAAILCVMSDALLRIGECAALQLGDFEAEGPRTLLIRESKTDQLAEGAVVPLRESTVRRVRAWLDGSDITAGSLFRRVRNGGHVQAEALQPDSIAAIVRRRSQAVGVEGRVSGHSLRVGSAKSLAAAGASLVVMQQAGRWESPSMPGRYARGELADRSPIRQFWGE